MAHAVTPATASRGMVCTNHPIASAAGVEMFAVGGNAVDAAVASLFCLSVVEPMMVGICGGGIANIHLADGTVVSIDNYSTSPLASSPTLYTPAVTPTPPRMWRARSTRMLWPIRSKFSTNAVKIK